MISYVLVSNPKWTIFDATGRLAEGGTITTWSSLDHSTPKNVYADPGGLFPYLDPVVLQADGSPQSLMYWKIDEDNPTDRYYVVVKDKFGNIIFTVDNFPDNSGGGVTPITSYLDIENHLVNGQFLFIDAINSTDSLMSPAPTGLTHVAPGSGFFKNTSGDYVPAIDPLIPSGWVYEKEGGTGVTDSIQFIDVTAIGEDIPNAPSANATRFFRYSFSGAGTSSVLDSRLTNIIPNVEFLQNETITVSFDTHANVVGIQGAFEITQFFGAGGTGPATISQAFTFSGNAWARQHIVINVPTIQGKTKGPNQDDAVFISWVFPLNSVGQFSIANLQVQRGSFATFPYIEQSYAQDQYKVLIDLITRGNALYRTGDYLYSDNGSLLFPNDRLGWLLLFDILQSIGKTNASGATSYGLEYKNLYVLWWNLYDQTECIVNGGRGANALADFNANKRMSIPQHVIGYVFAAAGVGVNSSHLAGTFQGAETHTLTEPQMPEHAHSSLVAVQFVAQSGTDQTSVVGGNTGVAGGNQPHNNMQPTAYKYLYVKL